METIILYIFTFIIIMALILRKTPVTQINAITNFFVKILSKIPFVGIIESFFTKK